MVNLFAFARAMTVGSGALHLRLLDCKAAVRLISEMRKVFSKLFMTCQAAVICLRMKG